MYNHRLNPWVFDKFCCSALLCIEIYGCVDLVLGLDGTSTHFGPAFNEFHLNGRDVIELICLVDTVGTTALDILKEFIFCLIGLRIMMLKRGMACP